MKGASLEDTVVWAAEEIVRNGRDYRIAKEERRLVREAYKRELKEKREKVGNLLDELRT